MTTAPLSTHPSHPLSASARARLRTLVEAFDPHASDFAKSRLPFDQAAPLPGRVYCHPEIAELETNLLLRRMWSAVGRVHDLADAGAVHVRVIAGESIVITADEDGTLRAFFNVCRHRGTRLVDACRSGQSHIQCPYHSWTYRLDGSLHGAPLMDDAPDELGLIEVPSAVWEGFLFVSLDPRESLESQLADAPDVAQFTLPELVTAARVDYDVPVNWKLLTENYNECYHCAVVHPQLHRITHYQSGGEQEDGHSFVGGPMRLNEGFNTMSMSGHTDRPSLPGVSDDAHDRVLYYVLYPNLWLSLHRDYVLVHRLFPRGAERTLIECEWLVHEAAASLPGFSIDDAVEFWDLTNRQDWEICEKTQQGVRSDGFRPVTFQAGEGCLHAIANWYLDAMDRGFAELTAEERP